MSSDVAQQGAEAGVRRTHQTPDGGRVKRAVVATIAALLFTLSVFAVLTAVTNDVAFHDRRALHAFGQWNRTPTAETESAWHEARRLAMIRDAKFKAVCLGVALASGILGWQLARSLRQRSDGSIAIERSGR